MKDNGGNKIALVFGGSRGIGAARVQALADSGFDIAYTYISSAPRTADAKCIRSYLFRAGETEEAKQRSAALSPFGRIGTPKEVAEVVSFLASDRASWVHGQVVQPNGGMI